MAAGVPQAGLRTQRGTTSTAAVPARLHCGASGREIILRRELLLLAMHVKDEGSHVAGCINDNTHLGVEGEQEWLDKQYVIMQEKFGRLTRQKLPFNHCGCKYEKISNGIRVDQQQYVNMLKTVPIDKEDSQDRKLNATETSALRSILGALMWTGITGPDLAAEISDIQSVFNRAKVAVVDKAKKDGNAAIYLKKLPAGRLRLVCIHGASAKSSTTNYAQEGVIILLMNDKLYDAKEHIVCTDDQVRDLLCGTAQLLYVQSNGAKRVSYSTSHGETLATINGLESSTLISTRLTEITYGAAKPTLRQLLAIQENGSNTFPVDCYRDCRDFRELSTGTKSLPQDSIYTIAHREARASARIRYICLIPTEWMAADALTKVMVSPPLMELLTTGRVRFQTEGRNVELKRLPKNLMFDEDGLAAGDDKLVKRDYNKVMHLAASAMLVANNKPNVQRMMLYTSMFVGAAAHGRDRSDTTDWALTITIILVVLSTLMLERMASTMWTWSTTRTTTRTAPMPTTRAVSKQTGRVFTDVDTQTSPPPEEQSSSSRDPPSGNTRPPVIRNTPPPNEV